jgi:hypothetical protein
MHSIGTRVSASAARVSANSKRSRSSHTEYTVSCVRPPYTAGSMSAAAGDDEGVQHLEELGRLRLAGREHDRDAAGVAHGIDVAGRNREGRDASLRRARRREMPTRLRLTGVLRRGAERFRFMRARDTSGAPRS